MIVFVSRTTRIQRRRRAHTIAASMSFSVTPRALIFARTRIEPTPGRRYRRRAQHHLVTTQGDVEVLHVGKLTNDGLG